MYCTLAVFLLYSLYCCTGSRNNILPDIPTVIKLGKETKNKSQRPLTLMVAKLDDNPLTCARGNKAAEGAGNEDDLLISQVSRFPQRKRGDQPWSSRSCRGYLGYIRQDRQVLGLPGMPLPRLHIILGSIGCHDRYFSSRGSENNAIPYSS